VRTRAVTPAMSWRCDQVVCLVVSLCEDYADFCVNTMSCCVKTVLLLCYIIFCCMPCFEGFHLGRQLKHGLYKKTNIFLS
jgi:hypothetical protein